MYLDLALLGFIPQCPKSLSTTVLLPIIGCACRRLILTAGRGRRVQLPFVDGASQPFDTQLCFSRYELFPGESTTLSPIVRGPARTGQKLFMPVLSQHLCSYHASHNSQAAGTALLLHRPSFDEPTLASVTLARPVGQFST
jgi:hypothetical protein